MTGHYRPTTGHNITVRSLRWHSAYRQKNEDSRACPLIDGTLSRCIQTCRKASIMELSVFLTSGRN